MPIQVHQIKEQELPVVIPFGDLELQIKFRPSAYTVPLVKSLGEALLVDTLVNLVSWWDLVGEDGEMVPINKETLEDLGIPFCQAVFNGILEHVFPNLKGGRDSSST